MTEKRVVREETVEIIAKRKGTTIEKVEREAEREGIAEIVEIVGKKKEKEKT